MIKRLGKITCILFLYLFSFIFFMQSCGRSNTLSASYQENNKEKAEDAIKNKDYDSAITLLNTYIIEKPEDYSAQSMLANVYMLKAGINLLDIIVNINNNVDIKKILCMLY